MDATGKNVIDGRAKPLRFVTMEGGCQVCLSHKLNQDGYFRKAWGNSRRKPFVQEMFHRFMWRAHKGPIPDGYEIDHLCENRVCVNVEHMRCIDGVDHTIHTNKTRVLRRKHQANQSALQTRDYI